MTIQKLLESGSGEKVEIASVREGETVGMHLVMMDSSTDTILFTHDAKSRVGFAEGAVRAAEWIKGKIRELHYSQDVRRYRLQFAQKSD